MKSGVIRRSGWVERSYLFPLVMLFLLTGCTHENASDLVDKLICIDPGHGGTALTDSYRVGLSGEREEWINLRVATILSARLKEAGAKVLLTRSTDSAVSLVDRAKLAVDRKADVFISIHHNAAADTSVNFPIIYFHGNASENHASLRLGLALARRLRKNLYQSDGPVSVVSDHVIFPVSGAAVLRNSYGIPAIIGEASFFTNPAEEQRLRQPAYNKREAQAYFLAIQDFFKQPAMEIMPVYSEVKLIPFRVLQEADRMNPIARHWRKDFLQAERLAATDDPDSLAKAIQLYRRSIRSFPDSWLARRAWLAQADILQKSGEGAKADSARQRAKEFYPATENRSASRR